MNGTDTLGAACQVNPETDAVVPFHLKLTNITASYAASPGVRISVDNGGNGGINGSDHRVGADVVLGSGATCNPNLAQADADANPGSDGLSIAPGQPLAPDGFTEVDGWFTIEGYYSPANPQGDAGLIHDAALTIGGDGSFNMSSFADTNQGSEGRDVSWPHVQLSIDPGDAAGCLVMKQC